ncbi:DUF2461 domain-containing protein [Oleiagrimonas sp. C23AA]|uniref:DUF2461 domain-containing protein n=1 Tax=Oleiagrimonas sp. C23AA TaxID=2719047 RepID=UPI00141DE58C|nr:DUF2461 domain-containing protein [Oleiagrimonas sp. C23AA]NII10923.1 DUF2461 domain-containing protein [Oleiagrimonas sp. C23AA]
MERAYFSAATFRFLGDLRANNTREWFQAHKDDYERHVREPMLALITDLQPAVASISAHYRADPRKMGGSMFRVQRDTRFAHNKAPYKPWGGARLFHERRREVQAPSFYLHIEPESSFAGGGLWHPESANLKRIREFIANNPAAWQRAAHSEAFQRHFGFWGERLKRPPRGFEPDHPLIEDLKLKNFAAGQDITDAVVCSAELRPVLIDTFQRIAPLVDYLCAALDLEF